jgi:hypothetical protein
MNLRFITENEKAIKNPNATHVINCRGLDIFLDEAELEELRGSINNLSLHPVIVWDNDNEEIEEYVNNFVDRQMKPVSKLVGEDYVTGYKEGIMHFIDKEKTP